MSEALVKHFILLLNWSRPQDWRPGAQPIVWLSVRETAHKLGISTSQVRRNEAIRNVSAEIEPERVIVLQVDAELQDERHYHPHELPPRIDIKGRYGTDFRPGFARLAEQHIRPAVCLYFTDIDCSDYPETRPDFPVVWVNYGPKPSDRNREPWGERIDIPTPRTRNR